MYDDVGPQNKITENITYLYTDKYCEELRKILSKRFCCFLMAVQEKCPKMILVLVLLATTKPLHIAFLS